MLKKNLNNIRIYGFIKDKITVVTMYRGISELKSGRRLDKTDERDILIFTDESA